MADSSSRYPTVPESFQGSLESTPKVKMLGAPYPVRLRSHSSPVRPRPPATGATGKFESTSRAPSPVRETPLHPVEYKPTSATAKGKKASVSFTPETPASPTSPPRRIFRLKRPASSSAALQPTYSSDLRPSPSSPSLPKTGTRKKSTSRPATSSGVPEPRVSYSGGRPSTATLDSRSKRESSPFRGFTPIMGTTSDFALLHRKKSRGSRAKQSVTIPKVVNEDATEDPKFSTIDRKIFQELKTKMEARDSQFTVKNGKQHHPYTAEQVPYPVSYERQVQDNDVWEIMWARQASGGLFWHGDPDRPPAKVLDLGCGSGSWILDCAVHWKDTQFVGLDIVPLHPDLYQVGSSQLASRITWVQANFLEGLPFQDNEFDLIHAKRIGRGVPEDKWDSLLEEIHRVLKPGGMFELKEEELTFPGKPLKPKTQEPVDLPTATSSTSSTSSLTDNTHSYPPSPVSSSTGAIFPPLHHPQPVKSRPPFNRTLSGSMVNLGIMFASSPPIPSARTKSPLNPHSQVPPRTTATVPPHLERMDIRSEKSSKSSSSISLSKEPIDPRDHSLLEFIYNEMHAARFINIEPVALLTNSLPLYFSDVCIHPPIILTFPPSPSDLASKSQTHSRRSSTPQTLKPSDINNIRFPLDRLFSNEKSRYILVDDSITFYPNRHITVGQRPLHKPSNSDASDSSAESTDEDTSDAVTIKAAHSKKCHIPASGVKFDVRSLNMHLSLRVREVLACAEEMWAWVVGYQESHLTPQTAHAPYMHHHMHIPAFAKSHPGKRGHGAYCVRRPYHEILVSMSRHEFDEMLTRFELDMQEKIGMGSVVQSQLGWKRKSDDRTQERKDFDQLCAEWDIHRKHKRDMPAPPPVPPLPHPPPPPPGLSPNGHSHSHPHPHHLSLNLHLNFSFSHHGYLNHQQYAHPPPSPKLANAPLSPQLPLPPNSTSPASSLEQLSTASDGSSPSASEIAQINAGAHVHVNSHHSSDGGDRDSTRGGRGSGSGSGSRSLDDNEDADGCATSELAPSERISRKVAVFVAWKASA